MARLRPGSQIGKKLNAHNDDRPDHRDRETAGAPGVMLRQIEPGATPETVLGADWRKLFAGSALGAYLVDVDGSSSLPSLHFFEQNPARLQMLSRFEQGFPQRLHCLAGSDDID